MNLRDFSATDFIYLLTNKTLDNYVFLLRIKMQTRVIKG
jgi:hypothetical protein